MPRDELDQPAHLAGHPGDGTVGKALDVLDSVASAGRPLRFVEILADSPYPKATLHRLLQNSALTCTAGPAMATGTAMPA